MDVKFRFQSTCHYNFQVSTSIREEIFLHQSRLFLAWDMTWVVFAPF